MSGTHDKGNGARPTTLLLAGGALVGTGLEPIEDAAVVIRAGVILEAGDRAAVEPLAGAEADVSDLRELTLIPGWIDAHVHMGLARPHEVVAGGVTAARDLGWPPEAIHTLARASRAAHWDGPALLAAGPMLTAPAGYPARAPWAPAGTAREVVGPQQAAAAVARTAAEGACVIKVALDPAAGPSLEETTLAAITAAAHERGLRVIAHVRGLTELSKALAAGVDELAHMVMGPDLLGRRMVDEMVAAGMTVVPTLSVRHGVERSTSIANLAGFVAAGGHIVYGTDLGNEGPRPGIEALEIEAMAEAGLTPHDILAAATVDAARYLGLQHMGVLQAGAAADIVGVAGDPLADTGALSAVRRVWRAGRQVPRPGAELGDKG